MIAALARSFLARNANFLRAMTTRSLTKSWGWSRSYCPAAARTKKLASTDWQMSMESKTRRSRGSLRRTRTSRRMSGS